MSGRRRATVSPSLFPFLAVLVCTLGTLILLLALVAQKAEQTAQHMAESHPQVDTDAMVSEQQWRREQLTLIRSRQTEELERRRSELAHVEDHLRRLRSQLQQLQAETAAAADPVEAAGDRQAELETLRQQIEQESQRVAQLRQQAPQKRPRVVIIPHKGPNGTDRRPVYVECTAEGIFLRPEDAHIAAVQLDGPLGPGNPLDAALRAVRNYWQQHDPGAAPPYPLLVVRPDGIDSYAVARAAMADWDDQFGYELVPADVELAFPKAQPDLRQQIDVAIRQAVARQHVQIAGQPRRYRPSAPLPTLSAAELARRGAAGRAAAAAGYGRGDQPAGYGRGDQPAGSAGVYGRPADPLAGEGEHTDAAGTAAAGNGSGHGINGQAVREFDDALRATAAAIAAEGGALGAGSPGGLGLAGPDGLGLAGPDGQPATDGSSAANRSETTGAATDGAAASGTAASDGAASDGAASGTAMSSAASSAAGTSPHATAGNGGSLAAGGGQATQQQAAAGSQSGGQSQASPSGNTTAVAAGGSTLRRDRANWALPEEMAGAHGAAIARPIHVVCRSDAFVLYGENGRGTPQQFDFRDGMVDRAALELAAAIQRRVKSWGLALPGGHWQPVLTVEVSDGAELRYRQLRTLLTGSGLTLERR